MSKYNPINRTAILKEEHKNKLLSIMMNTKITVTQLAKIIGIKYFQLWNPLNGRTNCSPETHKKIKYFIENYIG